MPILAAYVAALVSLLAIDGVWLAATLHSFYSPRLAHLLAETPSKLPAALFYLLYAGCVSFLVVAPALEAGWPLWRAGLAGAVLGLAAYAAYDLTNQATLRAWPLAVTVVDVAWGALLTGVVALAATAAARHFS